MYSDSLHTISQSTFHFHLHPTSYTELDVYLDTLQYSPAHDIYSDSLHTISYSTPRFSVHHDLPTVSNQMYIRTPCNIPYYMIHILTPCALFCDPYLIFNHDLLTMHVQSDEHSDTLQCFLLRDTYSDILQTSRCILTPCNISYYLIYILTCYKLLHDAF